MKVSLLKEDLIKSCSESKKTIIAFVYDRFFVLCMIVISASTFLISCESRKELINEELYEGPTITMDSIYTMLSDSGKVVMILQAKKQLDFENEDREWPEGLFLQYLDDFGNVETTFKADYVIYKAAEDLYRGEGNVVVINTESGDELTTEELFWDPGAEQFYTDRFVTILSEDEIHTGDGLVAEEDFSSYKITNPSGTITVEEDETP
jgi:LPS export ABC transporter protein LptC